MNRYARIAIIMSLSISPWACNRDALVQGPADSPGDDSPATKASVSSQGIAVSLHRLRTIDPRKELEWKDGKSRDIPAVTRMAMSPNRQWLLWGDKQDNLFAWSLKEKRLRVLYDNTVTRTATENEKVGLFQIEGIRCDDAGKVYWIDNSGRVGLADLAADVTQKAVLREWSSGPVWSACIADDEFIVCVPVRNKMLTNETVLEAYNLADGKHTSTAKLSPMKRQVEQIAVAADKKSLAVVSRDCAGIVALDPFKLQRTIDVQYGDNIVFSPDSSQVAIGTNGVGRNSLVVAEVSTGRIIRQVKAPPSSVRVLAWSPKGDIWYESDGRVYRLGPEAKESVEIFGWASGVPVVDAVAMVFVGDGEHVFVGTRSGDVVEFETLPASSSAPATKATEP